MSHDKHVEPEYWGPRFNTGEEQENYKRILAEYRVKTDFELSVAPNASFKNSLGAVRGPKTEVTDADFGPFIAKKNHAVACGALVRLTADELELARGTGKRLMVRIPHTRNGGISDIGSKPLPEHYAKEGLPARQVVRNGVVMQAEEEPAVSGEERIRELIKARFIQEVKSREEVLKAIEEATADHWRRVRGQ